MWHRFAGFTYGRDETASAWVVNHTNNWLSIGITTSPYSNGHLIGIWITDKAAKRVSDAEKPEERYKEFKGWLCQAAFWWFKFYLYLYFDGDGLK